MVDDVSDNFPFVAPAAAAARVAQVHDGAGESCFGGVVVGDGPEVALELPLVVVPVRGRGRREGGRGVGEQGEPRADTRKGWRG